MTPLLLTKDGISISIRSREHLPPHVHVFADDDVALVEIRNGEIYAGFIPYKKLRIVQAWLKKNNNWKQVEEIFYQLNERLRPEKSAESQNKKKKRNK